MGSAQRAWARALAPLAAIALVAVVTSAPLWRPLFVYGHSIDLDPFRQVAFDAALRVGDPLPRWTPPGPVRCASRSELARLRRSPSRTTSPR